MTTTSPYPTTERARGGLPKWVIPVAIVAAVLLLIVMPLIGSRNTLVNKEEDVIKQFAQIDVQLQRRTDLVPNLAEAVKSVLKQEQKVFGDIANARTQYGGASSPEEKVEATNTMASALGRLLVIVEAYPELKSNQTVQSLMTEVAGTENRISQERRGYNEVVSEYNRSIRRFPTSIVASVSGFERRSEIVTPEASRNAPKLDLNTEPSATPSEG